MPDPWHPPPFPKRGNRSSRVLYEAIGRALSTWEELETMLAHLYAALRGCSQFDTNANHAYGEELNFRNRLTKLEHAGCGYFVKRPNQTQEAELAWIIRYARGYSERRNDVAHGVVRLLHMVFDRRQTLMSGPAEWCLVPPHFREAKFVSPDMPAHILTSSEINRFAGAFWPIIRRAHTLATAVELPEHALRRKSSVPPSPYG